MECVESVESVENKEQADTSIRQKVTVTRMVSPPTGRWVDLTTGSLPDKYYSSSDPNALREFVSQCDILVGILPSTPQTKFMMTAELFGTSITTS